ncbi:MAG: putative inorganic carbon transporter subunit DabA [Bdellovibrionota bacterium]
MLGRDYTFDLDSVPNEFVEKIRDARAIFDRATCLDAHERCRRFDDVRGYSPEKTIFHVEGRAHNLREPRPEYGHATNSMCIVGKRSLTKGLFLDRRGFLASYDAELDTDGSILNGLLEAVIPVCAGINLEYYFSFVDNTNYGCGTKLPHNITGLIGVMDGYSSDLRTGLPWQMVEIHEPVRLLFLIQSPRSRFETDYGYKCKYRKICKK